MEIPQKESPCVHISWTPSILVRSISDQTSIVPTNFQPSSLSPSSIRHTTPVHSMIYEGEVIIEEEGFSSNNQRRPEFSRRKKGETGRRAKKRALSKSLSQLEFEELKGFMDLGFVFSEEDKVDSSFVSIVPGLQKLGKEIKDQDEGDRDGDHHQEEGDGKECGRVGSCCEALSVGGLGMVGGEEEGGSIDELEGSFSWEPDRHERESQMVGNR